MNAALRGCFVTGTDTEVGKTRVATALLHWLRANGRSCVGYKPVSAGTERVDGVLINGDVQALRGAGSVMASDAEVGPFQFAAACAPHIAAALEGRSIKRSALIDAAHTLAARAEWLVVEGVGGFCVPLVPGYDTADLAAELALPVLLVVGLRLGCINHALLSAEAIRARGLRLAGWVANAIEPAMLYPTENLATLRDELQRRHAAPCIGRVPHLDTAEPAAVATHLDPAALQVLFAPPR